MEPIGDPDDDVDFAEEHADVTVDPQLTRAEDDGEPESPQGRDGMADDGPP